MLQLIQAIVSAKSKKVQPTEREIALLTVPVGLSEPNTELEPVGLYVFNTDEPELGVEPAPVDVGL